jgi:hypothetical protein
MRLEQNRRLSRPSVNKKEPLSKRHVKPSEKDSPMLKLRQKLALIIGLPLKTRPSTMVLMQHQQTSPINLMTRENTSRDISLTSITKLLESITTLSTPNQSQNTHHTATLLTLNSLANSTTTSVISSRSLMPELTESLNGLRRKLMAMLKPLAPLLDTQSRSSVMLELAPRRTSPSSLTSSQLSTVPLKIWNSKPCRTREPDSRRLLPPRPKNSRRRSSI